MKLSALCINRPILATMLIGAFVVFGLISYRNLDVSLFPDVDFPIVTVTVRLEGADPETVETEITDPLEEAVNTIGGIKSLRSESSEGVAQVFIEFELEQDIDVASQEVRDKVAGIRDQLPDDAEPPIVEKFDPDSAPILAIAVSGPVSIRQLTTYADDVLKPAIEGIDGVGSVRIVGGREREIRIWLRVNDLMAYGITARDVIETLEKENVEIPGGRVETGTRELVVRTRGEAERVSDFEDLVITYRRQTPVRIRDVASVEDGMEDLRSLSQLNDTRAVSVLVRRRSGANLLAVATDVKAQLDDIRRTLPPGHDLVLAQDLSTFVADSLNEAQTEMLRGGVLAVLVILLFLRSLRGAFVAAITIPTTIIGTYSFMLAMGFTLNMMSMLALSLSVGMIIDDSIVVLENTFRHMQEGKPRFQAALAGVSEIGFAVIATSLAVTAVFVPVAFMKGLVGRFFFEFGLTVAAAVVLSTFIALTLSPMLCSRVLRVGRTSGRVSGALQAFFTKLDVGYGVTLRFSLRHRVLVLVGAAGVFLASLLLVPHIGKEFVPAQDEAQFNVQVETPLGSSVELTRRVMRDIESRLRDLPHVTNFYTTIGAGEEQRANVATLLVQLTAKDSRQLGQQELMVRARERLLGLSHLKTSVELIPRVSGGGFRAAPIQYNLRGNDLGELERLSARFIEALGRTDGIVDVNSTYDASKPEVAVHPDRDRAADLGVHFQSLGETVQTLIGGRAVSTFEERGERHDVRLRLEASARDRSDSILSLPVRTSSGKLVELRNLAEVEETTGPVQIDRQDRERQITILANVESSKPLGEAISDIQRIEAEIGLPEGVSSAFTGFADLMEESFASITFSIMLAIVLIYMILASQFESFVHPFTILLSVPFSIGGALGALALTSRTLNIFSMIGMIMLMGLVTKNAILLVDYTNRLRSEGMDRQQAVLTAGPVRLRPILMTAFSTIAGMFPIALGLGAGAETRAPMGTCVIGGLVTSTLLTLVVIPVMYTVMDDLAIWLKRVVQRTRKQGSSA